MQSFVFIAEILMLRKVKKSSVKQFATILLSFYSALVVLAALDLFFKLSS